MKKVIILGANGQIANYVTYLFLHNTDVLLTLYLRNSGRLRNIISSRVRIIEGDVLDLETLKEAINGQDVVYANLSGQLEQQARNIVEAMYTTGVKRLIFISSMGIYDEVSGEKHKSVLDPYCRSAEIIEASDLNFVILRPAWLNNKDEIDYQTTQKGEPFKGHTVSRKSVADLVVKLALSPQLEMRSSLGVSKI